MDDILGPLAFALLIGGQFLAAIVLISYRKTIYADADDNARGAEHQRVRSMAESPGEMELQH